MMIRMGTLLMGWGGVFRTRKRRWREYRKITMRVINTSQKKKRELMKM